jgi:hypothetical protein
MAYQDTTMLCDVTNTRMTESINGNDTRTGMIYYTRKSMFILTIVLCIQFICARVRLYVRIIYTTIIQNCIQRFIYLLSRFAHLL